MKEQIINLKSELESKLGQAADLVDLDKLRVAYLGKKGSITQLLKGMKDLSHEERKTLGAEVNKLKTYAAEKSRKGLRSLRRRR